MIDDFNFDEPTERRGGDSYKWDTGDNPDVIPMWVADMDFRTAPCVRRAVERRAREGIFGYVKVPRKYYYALCGWFERRHGWSIDPDTVIYTTGVVPAVSAVIKALTRPGDGVIVPLPAYNCFFSSVRNNGCRVAGSPLKRIDADGSFSYEMDFGALEKLAADPNNKVLILCNPHNPIGRVWTRNELERVRDICRRNGVAVISDEIHCELVLAPVSYVPYATVDPDAVVCCSPSKAFNTAGLQIANIVVPDATMRTDVDRAINDNEVCDVNPFGVAALIAAYDEGEAWLDALIGYLRGNYNFLREFFATNLPSLPVGKLEATYLAWVDISSLPMSADGFETFARDKFGVWPNAGTHYGCDGYLRINFATRRELLAEGLRRLQSAFIAAGRRACPYIQ